MLFLIEPVYAAPPSPLTPDPNNPNPITDLTSIFENALSAVVIIAGFAAFIMLIVSGFRYMTARGDPKAIASAQSTMVWSIAGLALIILAWLILQFIATFTGINITIFKLTV